MKIKIFPKKVWIQVLLVVLIFGVGAGTGWLVSGLVQKPVSITPIREPIAGDNLINPILYTNTPQSISYPTYDSLKNAYTQYIGNAEGAKNASYVAVYYQDMNAGEWIGINSTEKFDPASMLKVATLIAVFRANEENPDYLSSKVNIGPSVQLPNSADQSYYPPTNPIQNGNSYTVQQLADNMIIQSDDGADYILTGLLGNSALSTVFSDLHIPLPGTSTGVSAQEYSHLFRVLYNATYLSSDDSQAALQLLTQTTFTPGLVAGVPAGTVVAHKFGESLFPPLSQGATWPPTGPSSGDVPGLSDCGIIYYPNHPYFLCVMTQGTDFNTLAGVIKDLSHITWTQISAVYPNQS